MGRTRGVIPLIMKPVGELGVLAAIAAMGVLFTYHVGDVSPATLLNLGAVALTMVFLTIGLGLEAQEAKQHWKFVALVLAIGVPAKFALTLWLTGVFAGETPDAAMVMAIAQVDAISVALIMANPWMSGAAKAAMSVIALSDDPWTGLLAECINAFNGEGVAGLAPYAAFFGVVAILTAWWLVKPEQLTSTYSHITTMPDGAQTALLLGGVATAAYAKWYFVAAIAGLFIRPNWLKWGLTAHDRYLLRKGNLKEQENARTWNDALGKATLWGAFFILGLALASGGLTDTPRMGVAMGGTIVISHALVLAALLLIYRLPFMGGEAGRNIGMADAAFMVAAHQNGLTAFALAMGLGLAVGVIAVSVITTFAAYMALNVGLFVYYSFTRGSELLRK